MNASARIHQWRARAASVIVAAAIAVIAQQASGQILEETDFRHGTTLAGFIGASSQSVTDTAAGMAMGWEVTPHLTIEGRGLWLDAGSDADAFSALLGARVPFLARGRAVPFAYGGAGLYLASFGATAEVPSFYQSRLESVAPGQSRWNFDDFTMAVGGGADLFVASHLAVRPEVTVHIVMTGSDARAVPVFGAQFAFHFESHPIGSGRAPSAAAGTR